MPLKTYFDFAENEYQYFSASCRRNDVANIMGAIAQGICEKYMKHLIDQFDHPTDAEALENQKIIIHDHNLTRILRYIKENMGVKFDYEAVQKMRAINGYYLSARYPGDFTPDLTSEDIRDCLAAVESCRSETLKWEERLRSRRKTTKLESKIESAREIYEAQSKNNATSAAKDQKSR